MAIESPTYERAMIEFEKPWQVLRFVGRVKLLPMALSTKCRTCLPFYWHLSVTKWLKNGTIPQHFTRSGVKLLHKDKDRRGGISSIHNVNHRMKDFSQGLNQPFSSCPPKSGLKTTCVVKERTIQENHRLLRFKEKADTEHSDQFRSVDHCFLVIPCYQTFAPESRTCMCHQVQEWR